VLVLAGTAALSYSIPISIAIAVLIAIASRRIARRSRVPAGGGAYIVSKDKPRRARGLVPGAALLMTTCHRGGERRRPYRALTSAVPASSRTGLALRGRGRRHWPVANLRGIVSRARSSPRRPISSSAASASDHLRRFARSSTFSGGAPINGIRPAWRASGLSVPTSVRSRACTALTGVEPFPTACPAFKPPRRTTRGSC